MRIIDPRLECDRHQRSDAGSRHQPLADRARSDDGQDLAMQRGELRGNAGMIPSNMA